MKVLVNATVVSGGGSAQVTVAFIRAAEADANSGITWYYALSAAMARELAAVGLDLSRVHVFEKSIAKSGSARKRLKALERDVCPSVVFTVFGPAYVQFDAPHICGVADGRVTHSNWLAFRSASGPVEMIVDFARSVYKGIWYRRAQHWIVEASNASQGLSRRCHIPIDRISIIPNTCAEAYRQAGAPDAPRPAVGDTVRLLYLSTYYHHKNFPLIPKVAAELKRRAPERRFEFNITLPEDEPAVQKLADQAAELGVEDCINNVGPVFAAEAPELYRSIDICFMPSLLETFSANYPEAMAMGRPIATSDLDFSRAVCGEAAVYFDPGSAGSAATAILGLLDSQENWDTRIEEGRRVLAGLPTAAQRYEKYVDIIRGYA